MALESGTVDFVCTDMPTAQGALIAYPDLMILDFTGTGDDFEVSDEEINNLLDERTALVEELEAAQ